MKRILVTFLSTSLLSIFGAVAQSNNVSHWSFTAEYVNSFFFGDMPPTYGGEIPSSVSKLSYGAAIEYAFTPIWGLSVDYYRLPFSGANKVASFKTDLNATDLNVTVNFTKMIFPRSKSKFTLNGTVGMGLSIFNSKFRYPDPVNSPEQSLAKPVIASTIPIALMLEYNFSRQFALGIKAHYRTFNSDNLEGVSSLNSKGVTNDCIGMVSLAFRYKINATGNKRHLRNICIEDEFTIAMDLAKQALDKVNSLDISFKKLEKRVDAHDRKLDSLSLFLSNDGPDSDGDGVPDHRDKDSNTPANTPVDFWGKALAISYASQDVNRDSSPNDRQNSQNDYDDSNTTTGRHIAGNNIPTQYNFSGTTTSIGGSTSNKLNIKPYKKKKGVNIVANNYLPVDYGLGSISFDKVPTIYFAFDRIDLDDFAIESISKIAFKMRADTSLMTEVRGYCDYSGNGPYNNLLSQRRSDRVKAELVNVWKISPDRIISNGKGKIIEPRVRYRPNRRCDFFFNH